MTDNEKKTDRALDLLAEAHTMILDLVNGWPVGELHRSPDGLLADIRDELEKAPLREILPTPECELCDDGCEPDDLPGEDMDGDHESALASAGFGTDEDYGGFGGDGSEDF